MKKSELQKLIRECIHEVIKEDKNKKREDARRVVESYIEEGILIAEDLQALFNMIAKKLPTEWRDIKSNYAQLTNPKDSKMVKLKQNSDAAMAKVPAFVDKIVKFYVSSGLFTEEQVKQIIALTAAKPDQKAAEAAIDKLKTFSTMILGDKSQPGKYKYVLGAGTGIGLGSGSGLSNTPTG